MTGPANFRYPGDDPGALGAAALRMDEAGVRVDRTIQAVSLSRSALLDAWTMQATELADADLGTLLAGLPTVRAALRAAHDAVVAHQGTLRRIRRDIDDLETRFRQQAHVWESADHDYRQLTVAGSAPSLPLAAALATANAATAAQEDIWANYLWLLAEADASAQTCTDALTTAWDPQHRARSSLLIGPGVALMEPAGISSSSLNMLRIDAEVAEAGRLAADITAMEYLVGNDPDAQAKIGRLAEIWRAESTNGVFATAFYARIGTDVTIDLLARLGAVVPPNGNLDTGPLNQQLLHQLQTSMAQGFGVATQGIEYNADGALIDTTPGGLDADYLTRLMERGRSTISVPTEGQLISVRGYLPLLATLANGGGYSAGTLRAFGDDMLAVEAAYQAETGLAGDRVWFTDSPARPRWNWSAGGSDFPIGNDPFTSWTSAMLASPQAARTVLATDNNLLDYLLTDRSWTVADSGVNSDPAQWLYRMTDEHEPLHGLARFGDALPRIIGNRADSADASTAFDAVVQLLGTNDSNPRMDAGDFAGADWISPELRPGLGALLVTNVDAVHDAFAGSDGSYPYSVLVADVAKDSAVGPDGMTFADRLTVAETQLMTTRPALGTPADQQLDGQARLTATLSHGHTAADIGLQQRVDDEHNDQVDTTTWAGHLAVSPVGEIPVLGSTAQYLADSLVDRIGADNRQDNGLAARNDAAEWSAANHDLYVSTVENQTYAAALETGWRPTDPALTLTDGSGQLRLFSQFSQLEKLSIEKDWPSEFGRTPGGLGSGKGDVLTTHQTLLDEYLATKAGG
jgi:hypothetical protein